MLFSTPMLGFGGSAANVSLTFGASAVSASDLTEYTFSGLGISTTALDRKVVIGTATQNGTQVVSTLTVGGISATLVIALTNSNAAFELWQADVPTSTTADVVVTWSAATTRCGVGSWAIYGAAPAAFATASNTDDPMSTTLAIPAGGVAIGYAGYADGGLTVWTNLTEDFDEAQEGNTDHTGASASSLIHQTGLTITANPATAINNHGMVLASWGPA